MNSILGGLSDAFENFGHLSPVQQAIFGLALWGLITLVPQVRILVRVAERGGDWLVVWFRGALTALFFCLVLRYFLDLSPWVIPIGILIFDLASTMNMVYIVRRARESDVQRLAREVEEARLLLAAMEPRRADDV